MLRGSWSLRRSGHAEQLEEVREVFINVTTLQARSTKRSTRATQVSPRSLRSTFSAPACVPGEGKGGDSRMFKSLFALSRREDGQTMAEYGVVLAVITLLVVAALTALSGGISSAIDAVTGIL